MRNIIVNGDFQSTAYAGAVVQGTPGAGQFNQTYSAPLTYGWTLNADTASAVYSGGSGTQGISLATDFLQNTALYVPGGVVNNLVPGAKGFFASVMNGYTYASGATSILSIAQTRLYASRAIQGRVCDFSFWHIAGGPGQIHVNVSQHIGAAAPVQITSSSGLVQPGIGRVASVNTATNPYTTGITLNQVLTVPDGSGVSTFQVVGLTSTSMTLQSLIIAVGGTLPGATLSGTVFSSVTLLPLLDSKITISSIGQWREHRRQFVGPVVNLSSGNTRLIITITLDSSAASNQAAIGPAGGMGIAGVYFGVPSVDGIFDDCERLNEAQ